MSQPIVPYRGASGCSSPDDMVYARRFALSQDVLAARARADGIDGRCKSRISRYVLGCAGYMDVSAQICSVTELSALLSRLELQPAEVNNRLHESARSMGFTDKRLRVCFPGSLISLSDVLTCSFPGIQENDHFIFYVDLFSDYDLRAERGSSIQTLRHTALRNITQRKAGIMEERSRSLV